MNPVRRYVVYGMSIGVLLTVFYMLMSHTDVMYWLYIPMIGVGMLMIYMELFIMPNLTLKKRFYRAWITIVLGTVCISLFGSNEAYHLYYLFALFLLVRYVEGIQISYPIIFFMLMLGISVAIRAEYGHDLVVNWLMLLAGYGSALVIMLGIKYIIKINQNLEHMQIHLVEKNMELTHAYNQLRRAYDDLEDYTIIKERSYMSREMHDTVGHTLTTSLVELELCKILIKGQEEAENRLDHVAQQVRKGLTDLRMTVRKLKEDLDWEQEIYALGQRISCYTDIKVRSHIDNLGGIESNTLRCIYRIVQESLTNGIKHGKATAFMIEIAIKDQWIQIEIMDNGEGAIAFQHGFGLKAMMERVEALNGSIAFESYKDEGFTVRATLPKIEKRSQ
ncbi:MAG: hypothetical protein E7231_13770 [Cellulosilyticum sp.]|nr:hypothetical protein [Cellulosilyticum sp.]